MSFFTAHRITAVVVLVAAGAWVATGKFSSVGSEEVQAAAAPDPAAATPAEPAPLLRTVAAVKPVFTDFAREIRLAGSTEADKMVELAARSNGIVNQLGAVKGESIEAGSIVMMLDGAEVVSAVDTAKVSLEQTAEQLRVGEALYKKGSLPELELSNRRSANAAAESALSQAKAALDRLELRAPFTGTVDSVDVELGEWVLQGTPVATILSLDPIVIKAEVSERDVGYVQVGSKAKVRLVNGTEMEGTIRHLAKQASEKTRTFKVEVDLPNPDHAIPSGMTAEVSLLTAPQPALRIPRSIITLSDKGVIGLRVVGDDNKAAFVPVDVIDDGEQGLVVTGVPEGVRVIVAGQDLVKDGDEVVVSELTPAQVIEALK